MILPIFFLMLTVPDPGRSMSVAESPDSRVQSSLAVPPGPPPLLSFRYYEDKKHHRFDNVDLMLDDAGH